MATAWQAARQSAGDARRLLALSRPASWPIPLAVFLAGAYDAERGWSMAMAIGAIYFLAPFGLLRHGLDAIDMGAQEGPDPLSIRIAIAVTNLPLLVALVWLGGAATGLVLIATIALVIAETTAPLRLRDQPGFDLLIAGAIVAAPLLCGVVVGGADLAGMPWAAIAALLAWGAATAAIRGIARPAPGSTVALLGPRLAAVFALGAFGTATVLSVLLGTLGILGGAGMALFLLLPAMVLLAPAADTRVAAAAVRADADLTGLTLLVGAWLGVLLLQQWGVTRYGAWAVAIVVPAVLAAYTIANVLAIRIATRRHRVRSDPSAPGPDGPSVTIIVPCHDAAPDLPACLAAVRDQTYPDSTVLVVDGGSTDGSADEAAAWIGADSVLRAPPRPDGWTGRAWARHVGASAATTDLVVFVDPGVVLAPIAVRILVEQSLTRHDQLLLGLPRDLLATPAERAGVPGFALVQYGFAPLWWPALTGNRPASLAFGDGGLVLVRRSVFLAAAAGTEASPPDDSLPRVLARAGSRVAAVRMASLAAERRYRNIEEVVEAWRLRILPFGRGRLAGAIGVMALVVATYLVPLLLPAVAILGREDPDLIAAALLPLAVLVVGRLVLLVTQRHPPTTILWHPFTVLVMLIGQVAGIADHVRGHAVRS